MADLIADVGNTRTKVALFRNGSCVARTTLGKGDVKALDAFIGKESPFRAAFGATGRDDGLLERLRSRMDVLVITGETPTPLKNTYTTATTLGVDRLANAVGAWSLFPGEDSLVIDAGTCITYDLVGREGVYEGGAISPGRILRARTMHEHAASLPLLEPFEETPLLGTDTRGSMRSGVHHGSVAEMRGMISAFGQDRPDMHVILTGGDALLYARALKSGIFAHPFLTLAGLHAILLHHHRPPAAGQPVDLPGAEGAGHPG